MKRVAKVVEHTQGTLDPFVFNVVGLRGVRGLCCNKRARSPKNTILQDNKVFPGQLWGDPGSYNPVGYPVMFENPRRTL